VIVVLVLAARRPEPLRQALRDRVWRSLIVILGVSALVAYLANDTGSTAASPAFLYGMAALVVPALAVFEGAPPPKRRTGPKKKPDRRTPPAEAESVAVGAGAAASAGQMRQGPRRRKRRRHR
jgi:hypothetical protein